MFVGKISALHIFVAEQVNRQGLLFFLFLSLILRYGGISFDWATEFRYYRTATPAGPSQALPALMCKT